MLYSAELLWVHFSIKSTRLCLCTKHKTFQPPKFFPWKTNQRQNFFPSRSLHVKFAQEGKPVKPVTSRHFPGLARGEIRFGFFSPKPGITESRKDRGGDRGGCAVPSPHREMLPIPCVLARGQKPVPGKAQSDSGWALSLKHLVMFSAGTDWAFITLEI